MAEGSSDPPHVLTVLRQWDEENAQPNYDPVQTLTTLAEIIESETEAYMKMDPDPFDERHPSRAYPNCSLGYTLKVLFRKELFMTKLVNDYLRDNYYTRQGIKNKDVRKLNVAACRLMLDITPGLETSAVFEMPTNDTLIHRLFSWAEKSPEPLQTYATGLLAAAMEVQEIAVVFREQNLRLVPIMLERLHTLQEGSDDSLPHCSNGRPFAHLGSSQGESPKKSKDNLGTSSSSGDTKVTSTPINSKLNKSDDSDHNKSSPILVNGLKSSGEEKALSEIRRPSFDGMMSPPHKTSVYNTSDCSNSSWAEMETYLIGNVQMHPLTVATKQVFILKYLTPMGEYQEFLSHVFEKNALDLILQFINLREIKSPRVSFEALKYLAALLCHKKFSIEFINVSGLQRLLAVPRPSIAATGVSICLYYLAYCEDAMERVCLLPHRILSDLVRYSLWLLECSHDSGRCHATMFFGLSFQFRVILEEFDAQDGLRKLYNVISTLPILSIEDTETEVINEDEECSARQIVRHVCVALKKYFEAHLYIRSEHLKRAHLRDSSDSSKRTTTLPSYKACKSSPEDIREQINVLLEYMSFRASWPPVDNFQRLGGITLLMQIIAFAYDWNYSGRGETVRSVLDVLRICAVMPRVQMSMCSVIELPEDNNMMGINVVLGAAEGEIVSDPDVQRAALQVIITCVCAPIYRIGGTVARYSFGSSNKKRTHHRSSEEVIEKVWECFRTTNGIMVLLNLIQVKTPITDADSIRGLACQALAGLARGETVRQIISKLPLFTTGQLQNLMRDPILQDRRQEHVAFQKYALELLERVSGKRKPKNELEPSLSNIHRANVIAQTRIQFNDRDLLQLIHQHLQSHGLTESAETLQKEARLPPIKPPQMGMFLSPFTYEQRVTPTRSRQSQLAKTSSEPPKPPPGPIKLNIGPSASNVVATLKKGDTKPSTPVTGRSLEKKIYYEATDLSHKPRESHITLDSIITEYLTNQHALCKNPMSTCPQFTLFEPHKCPDPKARNKIPSNFAMRHSRGIRSRRLDQRLIHSKFCCVHIFRYGDDNAFFTCCDFFGADKYVIIGSHQGEVKLFNLQSGSEVSAHQCHESYISQVQCCQTNNLLLTSSTWRRPLSACWNLKGRTFEKMFIMDEEDYVEFSKLNGDKIIGTKSNVATIYDVNTGKLISTLKPSMTNQYTKNKATFSPTDELVLSDGVLWDVNSGKEIHKFDKLNQTLSGVFHPNGLEIVSNTEVWDLRTFHLLRTVPALDQSEVIFSPTGYTIYSVTVEREVEDDSTFENSFKTLDAYDYSSIATIDVKKSIYDLSCNRRDTQIALVENQGMFDSVQESVVKIYDIGRSRITDDEPDEDDEDDEDEIDASDGSNSDDDHQNDTLDLLDQLENGSDHSDDGAQDNSNDDDDDDYEMEIDVPTLEFYEDDSDSSNSA